MMPANWYEICLILAALARRKNPKSRGWIYCTGINGVYICRLCKVEVSYYNDDGSLVEHAREHLKEYKLAVFL